MAQPRHYHVQVELIALARMAIVTEVSKCPPRTLKEFQSSLGETRRTVADLFNIIRPSLIQPLWKSGQKLASSFKGYVGKAESFWGEMCTDETTVQSGLMPDHYVWQKPNIQVTLFL